jgi:sulfite exporter TauE/SafE
MKYVVIGFMGGLVAFPHCIGMCGGFMLHLSRVRETGRMFAGQFLWLAGKTLTYAFLGALAGYAGNMADKLLQTSNLPNILSIFAGVVIVIMGVTLLGLLPVRNLQLSDGPVLKMFKQLMGAPSNTGATLLGVVSGFLPCPIVLALLAVGVQSASVIDGILVMAAMGAGTVIPLVLFGILGRAAGLHFRTWGCRAGGVILVLLGLVTALRGIGVCGHLTGCHSTPAAAVPCRSGTSCSGHHDAER